MNALELAGFLTLFIMHLPPPLFIFWVTGSLVAFYYGLKPFQYVIDVKQVLSVSFFTPLKKN